MRPTNPPNWEIPVIVPVEPRGLAHAFGLIQNEGDVVQTVRINPIDYAELLVNGPGTLSDNLTIEERSQMVKTGVWSFPLWGAEVVRDKDTPPGEVAVEGSTKWALVSARR